MPLSPAITDELHRIYLPLVEALFPHYRVGGFNPGFVLIPREDYNGHGHFTLPFNAVRSLSRSTLIERSHIADNASRGDKLSRLTQKVLDSAGPFEV